ncbi:phage terminase small subunit P27 family [Aquabacter cavernae]|uniref:phage terminase small subunit P27 family n=1 Tax=Aquabacter cavernae TaxID=2496029 RepID=UPI00196B24D9|nr:phage terminase small subunit P27 family [Aquabacter cavernae]
MRGHKAEISPTWEAVGEDVPAAPDWLTDDALAEWERTLPILMKERRTLTLADLASFANYCTAVGQVAEAARILKDGGLIFMGPSGPKRHPAVVIRSDGLTQARQLAAELGLTPASRGRPGIREGADSDLGPLFSGGLGLD